MAVRKARVSDVPAIHDFINGCALEGRMLRRSLSETYERVREFYVAVQGGEVVGTGALHITWEDLAEIRSLAVKKPHRGRGLGSALVRRCLAEARELGITRVFVLTYIPRFFARFGFAEAPRSSLPHKIWADCIHCPHFPDCKEVPMAVALKPRRRRACARRGAG